jgi:hypothetical protein
MFTHIRIALVLSVLASQGSAQITPACAFTGPIIFPELESAKAAFLAGDYARFQELVGGMTADSDGNNWVTELAEQAPDGFSSCATVIQREDVGGFVQEITVFSTPDLIGAVTLHMQSAPINGQRLILSFAFNGKFVTALEELK